MRRAILILVLYLALGLVTTVAVAWVCAIVYQATDKNTRELLLYGLFDQATMENRGQVHSQDDPSWTWGRVSGTPIRRDARLPRWSVLLREPPQWGRVVVDKASGWPLLALRSEEVWVPFSEHPFEAKLRGRINVEFWSPWPRWEWGDVKSIPSIPIWNGLAVNTLFWSLVWAVIGMAPIAWRFNRSRRRIPKRLCGWCGYDLRKTPLESKCPECGRDVQSPPRLLHMPSWVVALVALVVLVVGQTTFLLACTFDNGIEPIHWAAYRGDIDAVRAELARGVDPNLQTDPRVTWGTYPLLLAIQQGHTEVAHALLDAGADPMARDGGRHGWTLTYAIGIDDPDIVRRILDAEDDNQLIDEFIADGLVMAATYGSLNVAEQLIELGADPSGRPRPIPPGGVNLITNPWGTSPVATARDPKVIEFLLDAGATFKEGTWSRENPFEVALIAEDLELADRLLDARFRPAIDTLTRAVWRDWLPGVRWLIEEANITSDPRAPFELLFSGWVSPSSTNRELWEYLLSIGAQVNVTHPLTKTTPLHRAVTWDSTSVEYIQFLLEHGANPNQDIGDGRTCIDVARRDDIRQLLIDAAAERDAANGEGD